MFHPDKALLRLYQELTIELVASHLIVPIYFVACASVTICSAVDSESQVVRTEIVWNQAALKGSVGQVIELSCLYILYASRPLQFMNFSAEMVN